MIQIIRADQRHFSDFGWLKTYWLFSFDTYHDPSNIHWGALRVFNDDVVGPKRGFPAHPHREMEIITVILSGEITHEDSAGNRAVVKADEVQRMSAGTGITHSEFNLADEPCHLYQIWIFPDERRLKPSYDQKSFAGVSRKNRLLPIASGQGHEGAVSFHTDAAIYLSDLDAGHSVDFKTDDSRRVFVYVTNGDIRINDERLATNDQARIALDGTIKIKAYEDASLILIDAPAR
ncbi:MAG TPA: pirin family protein [Blastocatellia bacterium]|nr:pirin family protein [Blastocatellia bacterium]